MPSSLQRIKRPTADVTLTSAPSLPNGNDAEVAAKLEQLVASATNGLMVIATLGAFISHIKDSLKHGEFDKWIAAHCPNVSRGSVFRWRKICAGLIHDAGVSRRDLGQLDRPLHEILELPLGDLNDTEAKIVTQIRDQAQRSGFRKLENRPIRSKPALSPEDEVAIKKKAAHDRWLHVIKSLEVCYDDLHLAVAHDATIITTIEDFRIKLGTQLSKVTAAIKSRRA